jgi:hypothetical protein
MNTHVVSPLAMERMVSAMEKVRDRLQRACRALEHAAIPYAVAGGNAVAAWVSEVDEAAVRNTQDVDILVRRADLEPIKKALENAGFIYRHSAGIDMFLDGPGSKARNAVHLLFAGERIREEYLLAAPNVDDSKATATFRVLELESLVKMKLTSYRRKDQVHIQDLIAVGLVDESWLERLPVDLRERLQTLLDEPED